MEKKKRVNIYITDKVANILKAHYVKKTGQQPNLSGALAFISNEIEKGKKTH